MIDDFIIRRKQRQEEQEEAGGTWKICLADFFCALMITFFALWAVGMQDQNDVEALAQHFRGETVTHDKKMELLNVTYEEIQKIMADEGIIVTLEKNSKGIVIKFDSESLFESGSYKLKPDAGKAFDTLAKTTAHTGLFYHTYGYTDNIPVRRGSEIESNLMLSIFRATAAAEALIRGGITSNRVTIHGEGLLNPAKNETTAAARQANRRVEIYMSTTSAPHKIYKDNVTFTSFAEVELP